MLYIVDLEKQKCYKKKMSRPFREKCIPGEWVRVVFYVTVGWFIEVIRLSILCKLCSTSSCVLRHSRLVYREVIILSILCKLCSTSQWVGL